MANTKPKAHTSDGEPRANKMPITLPPIPYTMSEGARVGVLNDIGMALRGAGANIAVIDRNAAFSHNGATTFLNNLILGANQLGATPPLPFYHTIDYNSFTSVIQQIVAGVATIP